MTRELDPQLVEAVAIAINADEACWAGVNVWTNPEHGINEQTKWEYRRLATAAITSADAHRAPQVREAVQRLAMAAEWIQGYPNPENSEANRGAYDDAYTDLLRLLGAQEGDDA